MTAFNLIGIGQKVMPSLTVLDFSPEPKLDAADFYHTTMFSDSPQDGLGSWGDPNNDFQISTGVLKDMKLAYPVPHNIRRNYTLHPYFPPGFPIPTGVPAVDPTLMLNTTFTSEIVNATLNSTPGDYVTFQTTLENFSGPHPGPHLILGGDMGGVCPFGLGPPGCVPGPKWSPNGEQTCSQPCALTD